MINQKLYVEGEFGSMKVILDDVSTERIFLVRGKSSYKHSGAESFIKHNFGNSIVDSFHDFNTNPQLSDLKKGIALYRKHTYKLIVAIGGGSVIDMAKLISVFAHQTDEVVNNITGNQQLLKVKTPVLAIPTTAGSGAEATHFSVLYINKDKYSVANNNLLPNYVYVTSEFSKNAGSYLTACAGVDAFSQAIESVWSVNSNAESKKYALKSIKLIWDSLYNAVHDNNPSAKSQLAIASNYAGRAINITKTTAPHAFSYAFTSYYNIPHGHAVALSLPFFFEYNISVGNEDCMDKRGAGFVKKSIDEILKIIDIDANEVSVKLRAFFESLGLKMNISELITNFEPHILSENINIERLNNNPRKVLVSTISDFLSDYNK